MDVRQRAVLEQGRRDEQPVIGRLLDERDDRRQPPGRRRQLRQARVVEPHRDLGREVLELVAGQAELGEDDEVGATVASLAQALVMRRQVRLERAETRRDLGQGDPECLHVPEHTRRSAGLILPVATPIAIRC